MGTPFLKKRNRDLGKLNLLQKIRLLVWSRQPFESKVQIVNYSVPSPQKRTDDAKFQESYYSNPEEMLRWKQALCYYWELVSRSWLLYLRNFLDHNFNWHVDLTTLWMLRSYSYDSTTSLPPHPIHKMQSFQGRQLKCPLFPLLNLILSLLTHELRSCLQRPLWIKRNTDSRLMKWEFGSIQAVSLMWSAPGEC